MRARQAPVREAQEAGEVVGVPPAVGVRLAEPDAALVQDAGVHTRVVYANGHVKRGRSRRGGVVAEARVPEGIDKANGAAGEPFEELHDNRSSETPRCVRRGTHRMLLSRRREG